MSVSRKKSSLLCAMVLLGPVVHLGYVISAGAIESLQTRIEHSHTLLRGQQQQQAYSFVQSGKFSVPHLGGIGYQHFAVVHSLSEAGRKHLAEHGDLPAEPEQLAEATVLIGGIGVTLPGHYRPLLTRLGEQTPIHFLDSSAQQAFHLAVIKGGLRHPLGDLISLASTEATALAPMVDEIVDILGEHGDGHAFLMMDVLSALQAARDDQDVK